MGLFGKLFEKKICDICGGEIGLLGNRKLEDGNCCKKCAKKLSPWFDDRRHSTIAQINEQLEYRARNAEELRNFTVTQIIGDGDKMYVEEINGVPERFFVTSANDYMEENPDIISFKDVASCVSDIRTYERELTRDDGNGNDISYNPPRYETDYDFYIEMKILNNPYFDDIRFKINSWTVTLETRGAATGLGGLLGLKFGNGGVNFGSPIAQENYNKYIGMCQEIEYIVQRSKMAPQQSYTAAPASQPAPAAENNASGPKFCQYCGSPVNGGKFCTNCGAKL